MAKSRNILILGGNGMFGANIFNFLKYKKINTYILTTKKILEHKNFTACKITNKKSLSKYLKIINKIIKNYQISIVINCLGYTKHVGLKDNRYQKLINSDLPKKISIISSKYNTYFIHFSTDCVFSGKTGPYNEKNKVDFTDSYGKYKYLGENLRGKNYLVLRTSGIGHEYKTKKNLLEWFLNQPFNKKVFGYKNVYFTGPTVIEISQIIYKFFIKKNLRINGLFQLGAKKISKYNLLILINKIYKLNKKIIPIASNPHNRSLLPNKFTSITKYKFKSWNKMILNMYNFNKIFKKKKNEYIV